MRHKPKTKYTVEKLLRYPVEYISSVVYAVCGIEIVCAPHLFLLTQQQAYWVTGLLMVISGTRAIQGYRIHRYQRQLHKLKTFSMTTDDVPLSHQWLYLGRGFRWQAHHCQRLYDLNQVKHQKYATPHRLKQWSHSIQQRLPASHRLVKLTQHPSRLNPMRLLPDSGGKPWLHGIGYREQPIYLSQQQRNGHVLVLGTTRVGKTRLASLLINQDIRNGEAVIVLDPKGDFELMRDIYSAASSANRLDDVCYLHAGLPDVSARYNPLAAFANISEVATRITSGISSSGDDVFKDFAWKYINIVACCLYDLKKPITYQHIAFYITHLDDLLVEYINQLIIPQHPSIKQALVKTQSLHSSQLDKHAEPIGLPLTEAQVMKLWLGSLTAHTPSSNTNKIPVCSVTLADLPRRLLSLFEACQLDKQYYDKITANISPILDKINHGSAAGIFSFTQDVTDNASHTQRKTINLMEVIEQRQIIYIGLDALSNKTLATAIGKALIADLVSTVGLLYKKTAQQHSTPPSLCLHADEFSDIIESQFVTLLNKAGGAGVKVVAYSQTLQDIQASFAGNPAMAKMTEGNFNTLIMLRVKNKETAELLTHQLPNVDITTHTPISSSTDTAYKHDGIQFNSSNEDRVQTVSVPMLSVNDIVSLPKGQAFVFANGGELYKIRIPLPKNDATAPCDLHALLHTVNHIT